MATQFVVPQFLDVETKIIGPITGRQFFILLGTMMACFLVFRLVRSLFIVVVVDIFILFLGLAFSFAKVNGQPLHYIVLNMIQTLRRPAIRVWDKNLSDAELKDRLKEVPVIEKKDIIPVKTLGTSRLSELSLIVNTGGAYTGDVLLGDDKNIETDMYGGK
jgi:hypothetical protein